MPNEKPESRDDVRAFVQHVRSAKASDLKLESWQIPFRDAFLGGHSSAAGGKHEPPSRPNGKR